MDSKNTEDHGGRDDEEKGEEHPVYEGPEEKADRELLDNEIRKDTHEDSREDPKPKDLKPDGGEMGGDGAAEGEMERA